MGKTLVDTSVVIALGNQHDVHYQSAITDYNDRQKQQLRISVVTLSEALVIPARYGTNEFNQISRMLKLTFNDPLDVTNSIASSAVNIRAQSKISLPDALILATALEHEMDLWTFDKKLFEIFTARK